MGKYSYPCRLPAGVQIRKVEDYDEIMLLTDARLLYVSSGVGSSAKINPVQIGEWHRHHYNAYIRRKYKTKEEHDDVFYFVIIEE